MFFIFGKKENPVITVSQLSKIIKKGGIGIIPTDTIYGIVGSAFSKKAVERIYLARKRDLKKPCIVLISSHKDLEKFGIKPSAEEVKIFKKMWPGPISIVFETKLKKLSYLHRGTNSIAFRVPNNKYLLALLKKSGPLIAPSANLAGQKPAKSASEALEIFGDQIDFYVDEGVVGKTKISTLVNIDLKRRELHILRAGAFSKKEIQQTLPRDWRVVSGV